MLSRLGYYFGTQYVISENVFEYADPSKPKPSTLTGQALWDPTHPMSLKRKSCGWNMYKARKKKVKQRLILFHTR